MRICGGYSGSVHRHTSSVSEQVDTDGLASVRTTENLSDEGLSQQIAGAHTADGSTNPHAVDDSTENIVEWEPEFERTVGLHSNGGLGMQQ